MKNMIINSFTNKKILLSDTLAEVIYKGIVITGSYHAQTNWEKDILMWFSEKNPRLSGAGMAGFDVTTMGWSLQEFETQKEFLVKVITQVKQHKSWNNYNYRVADEEVENEVEALLELFSSLEKEQVKEDAITLNFKPEVPGLYRYCEKHIVIENASPAELKQNCIVCGTTEIEEIQFIEVEEIPRCETFPLGWFLTIKLEKPIETKEDVYKILDQICLQKQLLGLGNLWCEMEEEESLSIILNTLTYDLAFRSCTINTDEYVDVTFKKLALKVDGKKWITSLFNYDRNPWKGGGVSAGWYMTDEWTFSEAFILATSEIILFGFSVGED